MEMLRLPEGLVEMAPRDCGALASSERQQMTGPNEPSPQTRATGADEDDDVNERL
jgi:hypothetical protein